MSVFSFVNYLSLPVSWFLFFLLFFLLVVFAVVLPYFLVNFVKHWQWSVSFVSFVFLSIGTSLPELMTVLFFPVSVEQETGVVGSLAVILGSNLLTGLVVCFLSLLYFATFLQGRSISLLRLSFAGIFLLNLVFLFFLLFPQWFAFWRLGSGWSFFSGLLLVFYFAFLLYLFFQDKGKMDDNPTFQSRQFLFKTNFFVLLIWIIFLVLMLLSVVLLLIALTNHLKKVYQFSDWTVGGFFFALATSSPEVWASLSLFRLGFAAAAWSVVIGSHLFNWILFFSTDFVTDTDLFLALNKSGSQLLEFGLVSLIGIIILYWASRQQFYQTRIKYSLPFLALLLNSCLVLVKIG